jgi:Cu-Zn family superoxide dismutase
MRNGIVAIAFALAACASDGEDYHSPAESGPDSSATLSARLHDAAGETVGTASATQERTGIRIRIEATGLPPGAHGAHVHAVGSCTPPSFDSAGPHWNPGRNEHGSANPRGRHDGDLPNLLIGAQGSGTLEYKIPAGRLAAMADGDGASVVIHAQADDYRTDPTGNSGARIACGVLR